MMRVIAVLALCVFAAAAVGRYRTEIAVKEAQARLADLRLDVEEQKRRIAVLRAELAHLEDPERLRQLAARHTELEAVKVVQLTEAEPAIALVREAAERREEDARAAARLASLAKAKAATDPIAPAPTLVVDAAPAQAPDPVPVDADPEEASDPHPIVAILMREQAR
ncbi:MAG: hypothetical protein AAGL49_15295 [Pseudomonadota bacterium]